MGLQNRGWRHGRYRAFKTDFDRRRLAGIGHDAHDPLRLENLANRHRYRLSRNVLHRREPTLPDLLPLAGLVESDDDIRLLGVEVSGRIVEGQVTILANPDERDVDVCGRDRAGGVRGDPAGIALPVKQVIGAQPGWVNQAREQVAAEAGRMFDRESDVLVEMKHLDRAPLDPRKGDKGLEEFELRGAG